jgi:hypothetical protein
VNWASEGLFGGRFFCPLNFAKGDGSIYQLIMTGLTIP